MDMTGSLRPLRQVRWPLDGAETEQTAISLRTPGGRWTSWWLHATCLTVNGGNAAVGIRIDEATGSAAPFVGNGFFLSLDDGGSNDLYANSGFTNAVQEGDCSSN
jgi:hypothetical protein